VSDIKKEKKIVTFKWNDQEIQAEEGSNLLKAALDHGIEVAHYCYHPGLSVSGVCRMCMVEQIGDKAPPRPYPSCNATVSEGIHVRNDTPKVTSAVQSTLEFHLVNHPLDCTICDQAGECKLQEYYMEHGAYDSSMVDKKVHKEKVQDIGRNVMLDAERCILCSRCVRFTAEITKTHELGILNRGDHAEITAIEPLKNDYAANVVDICPVGALTSKDFRFNQRVWFLEDLETTCLGCVTGCSVKISQNHNGAFRVRPREDQEVNGYWMCDEGREIYKHLSSLGRLQFPLKNNSGLFIPTESEQFLSTLPRPMAIILSTHLTVEEYEAIFHLIPEDQVYFYRLPEEGPEFDSLLKRSDKNANRLGLEKSYYKAYNNVLNWTTKDCSLAGAKEKLNSVKSCFIVVPEFLPHFIKAKNNFENFLHSLPKECLKIALAYDDLFQGINHCDYLLPVPTFAEKDGTFFNFKEQARTLKKGIVYSQQAQSVPDYLALITKTTNNSKGFSHAAQ